MKLFLDTETTGKFDFKARPDAPHQPRLLQFAALLTEDAGEEVGSVNLLVKPDGWTVPAEAAAIHGITTERAILAGVPCEIVLKLFRQLWDSAALIGGHNVDFDFNIMDGEFCRAGIGGRSWGKPREMFCTMHAMTPFCKLPGNYGDFKWPKLQEAHKHAFGAEFDGAHDAMADVRACARIYFWLEARKGGKA